MKAASTLCLILCFLHTQSYVILDSCPPGCECFERNTVVECREAHLSEIPVMRFASDVKRLVLRGNVIENVHEVELKRYRNLEFLDLRDNEISTLAGSVFSHNPHLKEINLGLNPFLCDCDLQDFSKVLHKFTKNGSGVLHDTEVTNCAAPQVFVGRPVLDIVFQDEYNKRREKERMYIGETENRGIAICPKMQPRALPIHSKLRVRPATTASTPDSRRPVPKEKKASPNYALITATVLAAILVTCISLATAINYYLKKKRSQGSSHETSGRNRKNTETFSEKIKQQRRASRGYAGSHESSDEETSGGHTTYFKSKLKDQRRHSQGYSRMHATTGSASELEDIELAD